MAKLAKTVVYLTIVTFIANGIALGSQAEVDKLEKEVSDLKEEIEILNDAIKKQAETLKRYQAENKHIEIYKQQLAKYRQSSASLELISELKDENNKLKEEIEMLKEIVSSLKAPTSPEPSVGTLNNNVIPIPKSALSVQFFGVHLGETTESLKGRFRLSESQWVFEDEDNPSEIMSLDVLNSNVKEFLAHVYKNKVYKIKVVQLPKSWLNSGRESLFYF